MSEELLPLRPNVCILLYNSAYDLFIGERRDTPGIWQFPQGGVEAEFSLEENVLRELEEETGAARNLFSVTMKLAATHQYEFQQVPEYAKGKWRGQSQTFWLVRFLGEDSDFRLDRFEPEFTNFCWCSPEAVRARVESRRLPGYLAPLAEFEAWRRSQINA